MKAPLRLFFPLLLLSLLSAGCASAATTTPTTPTVAATATAPTAFGVPSTSLQLGGLVQHPGMLRLADLQALPLVTVSVNVKPIGMHTFGGPLLSVVLQKAGVITQSNRKNDLLRKAIVVAGTDGYTVGVAWAEIDPAFANKQVLLAYQEDGKPLPQKDGFVRLIVPGDLLAGRYVSNVASVIVSDPATPPPLVQGQPTQKFSLTGQVKTPGNYDLAALKALKNTQVTVAATTYTGVLLNDLLQQAGLQLASKKNAFLRIGILAIGSDGYNCLIADGEIQPNFGNVQVLIAFAANRQPLPTSVGFARIIVPGDQKMGRFVSNLQELQVVQLTSS